jgi:hypothetical protein
LSEQLDLLEARNFRHHAVADTGNIQPMRPSTARKRSPLEAGGHRRFEMKASFALRAPERRRRDPVSTRAASDAPRGHPFVALIAPAPCCAVGRLAFATHPHFRRIPAGIAMAPG